MKKDVEPQDPIYGQAFGLEGNDIVFSNKDTITSKAGRCKSFMRYVQ